MRLLSACALLLPALAGCQEPASPVVFYDKGPSSLGIGRRVEMAGSLFPSDAQVISNEALEKILTSHATLPEHGRIAILSLEPRGYYSYYWSEELTKLNQQAIDKVTARLRACPRVADASVLPAMLVPEHRTIPYLREAAARYQADLLLVYQTSTSSFEKQKIIGPDQVKAFCRVDAALLDTRTGIVPFTAAVTRDYKAEKTPADLTFEEAVERAKLTATGDALAVVANDLAAFLDKLPPASEAPQTTTLPTD